MLFKATWHRASGHSWMISRNVADGCVVGYTVYKTKETAAGWLYVHLGWWTATICLVPHSEKSAPGSTKGGARRPETADLGRFHDWIIKGRVSRERL